ncbi:hypothetical protein [Mycolicibacterium gadium]|uniref:DUF5642 domain-containing protein n=1 Tax=Mycolicibacterium gadium TaxID=1794 RepID=A0A7I7WJQ7_MYCGU|nr:hypothetical protein [Mycolicibacterium gadium]BBZ17172.1 hypothetical protein MGAD_15070 [Mycolicibacterium gadium]
MGDRLSRCLRGCALLMVAASLAACSRVVVGASEPASGVEEKAPVPVAQLLIEPNRFPPQYAAAELDDGGLDRVVQDIDAVSRGEVVTPPTCTPPVLWHSETVGVEGVDSATASRLILVVMRPVPPLSSRLEQLRACPSFDVGAGEQASTVDVTVLPAPPVDADDAYAVEQTVTTPESERTVLTFAAQIGDTRVSASWLQDPAVDQADTSSLDALFRDAVVKLRRDG